MHALNDQVHWLFDRFRNRFVFALRFDCAERAGPKGVSEDDAVKYAQFLETFAQFSSHYVPDTFDAFGALLTRSIADICSLVESC